MILINNIELLLDYDFNDMKKTAAAILKIDSKHIQSVGLHKKSVDARKKDQIRFCCSFLVETDLNENVIVKRCKNATLYLEKKYVWPAVTSNKTKKVVVVGSGPAGLFAGLILARAGLKPVIIERGSRVEERVKQVDSFFSGGELNTESNVQFGEGGAGTFSDGKLTTGIKNFRCRTVLETFNRAGAPDRILTDAKPHIGTDILRNVVANIRNEIISCGGEFLFDTKLTDISVENGRLTSVTAGDNTIICDYLVCAIGHSARDTYEMLLSNSVKIVQKPFSVGVRIEHLQEDINRELYGSFAGSTYLGPADYKLSVHLKNGRGVYTFCMCPGGQVVNASSENGALAVNGMSYSGRAGVNANSAVLVGVTTEDFGSSHPLAGCYFQKRIEQAAYNICNGAIPITTVGNFINGKKFVLGRVMPTVKPNFVPADFSRIFPECICDCLKLGIIEFGSRISGFDGDSAVLTAPETRSSAPVRILRGDDMQSVSVKGLYPCGEGSGYAGGIVSAAVDGMTCAEKIIESINKC